MRTSRFSLLIGIASLLAATAVSGQTAKKPLDHDTYDIWNRIAGQSISNDGRWVLFGIQSDGGDPRIVVKPAAGGTEIVLERAEAGEFTDDARFVVFRIKPAKALVKQMQKDRVPAAQMPQDSFGILDVGSGQVTFRAERVRAFALPRDNSAYVAYHLARAGGDSAQAGGGPRGGGGGQRAGGGPRGGGGGQAGSTRREDGTTLVVRSLASGQEQRVDMVSAFQFAPDGSRIFYTTMTRDSAGDGAHVMTTSNGQRTTLASGKGDYKSLAVDESGTQVAFLTTRDNAGTTPPAYSLYHWDGRAAQARSVATTTTAGIPQGWWVSDDRAPNFSKNGQRLFFGTAPVPEPEPRDTLPADERVVVDVWAWTDPLLQPNQLVQVEQERNRNYIAVVHLRENRMVQLATADVPDVVLAQDGDADVALGRSNLPYRQQISWGTSGNDIYQVNVRTGQKEKLLDYIDGNVTMSPATRYLTWFDGEKKAWLGLDLTTKKPLNLSEKIPTPVHNELHDTPDEPGAYGTAGWTENDAQFLIYDRTDIWAVDPTGTAAPRNITEGTGQRENIRFRYARVDPEETSIKPNATLLLSAFHLVNKQSGFYRDRFTGNTAPTRLVMQDRSFGGGGGGFGGGGGPRKAENADVFMFTRGNFQEFPDLYTSGPDFTDMRKLSDANPQQKDYSWGTAELVDWRSAHDNSTLQGVLYKPENFDPSKKYPMMVYFYERLSDQLNNYVAPSPGGSSINISFYVSRGYLVFTPDIPYQIGYPGESALKAVVPGVQSLVSKGFVDEDAIGVQGHSWGGYQIAYLVTKTNIFKAAEAGAPVANMISAYGGIRWESGLSRMMQYEKTQSRIGGTLWEAPIHFIENSPIFWADKVQTPLLMMHNDEDGAVPWEQGIEYFVALRRLNRPVWMLNYNGEAHGLRRMANRKDWTIRMQQFFDHYLKGDPMPVWMHEGVPALRKGKTLGLELITPKVSTEPNGLKN
jgi:dipeptidyl aminopeptidase/acylaminoacyl peptidase